MTNDSESRSLPRRIVLGLLSQQFLFLFVAIILLLLATSQFNTDLPAFFWSLIVLGGVTYIDYVNGA